MRCSSVSTPARRGDGYVYRTYVIAAEAEIKRALTSYAYAVVVMKPTVPVGPNRKVAFTIWEANPAAQFDAVSTWRAA